MDHKSSIASNVAYLSNVLFVKSIQTLGLQTGSSHNHSLNTGLASLASNDQFGEKIVGFSCTINLPIVSIELLKL